MLMDYPDVPCDGCTRCCKGDTIRLLPEDDPTQYRTVPHAYLPGHLMLDHKPNGDCIYLGKLGCTIHNRSPLICRQFDCRNLARNITFTQARKLNAQGRLNILVWHRGKELLRRTSVLREAA